MTTSIGYGDIIPTNIIETTYATFVILLGGLFLPAIVGGLAAYMGNFNIAGKTFQKKLARVRSYLLRINIGDDVLEKVLRYYNFHWSRQGGIIENEAMDKLPTTLSFSVASHING